ncbi:PEP-CTERM sorting domain-containing protein [Parasalinivibrio latis]|uniref:PEP-CTERM sorting domain-containing protein n=1 Tax=Parasalinivibrio latis TaxID=2952610 RepID=UPI0030E47ADA
MIHNSNDHSGNGSNVAYAYNQSSLSVARTDGTGFSLNSFDAGETLLSPTTAWADQVKLTGYDALGAVVIQALFTLDHIASPISGLQTFTTSGFTNLARIEFAGVCLSGSCNNREFSIDNLALIPSPVPEPVTLALLITGITFWQVRKRQFK